jgi:hypothetical protein
VKGTATMTVHVPVPGHEVRAAVQAAVQDLPGVTGEVSWDPSGAPLRVRRDVFQMETTIYAEIVLDGPAQDVMEAIGTVKAWLAMHVPALGPLA